MIPQEDRRSDQQQEQSRSRRGPTATGISRHEEARDEVAERHRAAERERVDAHDAPAHRVVHVRLDERHEHREDDHERRPREEEEREGDPLRAREGEPDHEGAERHLHGDRDGAAALHVPEAGGPDRAAHGPEAEDREERR